MSSLSRKEHLAEKIVFVDGLPGCGKTLFSNLVSGMGRVELLSYSYEIEYYCALHYLDKMTMDVAKTLVHIQTDLKLYNIMMGRDVNFRLNDLSSAVKNHNPSRYIQRLFGPGDEHIPKIIKQEKPILNFASHNLLSFSEPIWQALGERCTFIEIVRHPLYMIRQQSLNMQKLTGDVRHFAICYNYKGHELQHHVHKWEEDYLNSNSIERVVHFLDKSIHRTKIFREKLRRKYNAKIITIPFEKFVLNPEPWIHQIAGCLETNITDNTYKVMAEQNVPRDMVADGVNLEIYRRCGWTPPLDGSTERDELEVRREDVVKELNSELISVLDKLSSEYEKEFWNPDEHT
jgi:hypothetical protein